MGLLINACLVLLVAAFGLTLVFQLWGGAILSILQLVGLWLILVVGVGVTAALLSSPEEREASARQWRLKRQAKAAKRLAEQQAKDAWTARRRSRAGGGRAR